MRELAKGLSLKEVATLARDVELALHRWDRELLPNLEHISKSSRI
jgi:hypothetical protein